MSIGSHETASIAISLTVCESESDCAIQPTRTAREVAHKRTGYDEASASWIGEATCVRTNSEQLNRVLTRSLRDLHLLRTTLGGRRYFAAGVPWFVTLFGRDSIIAAIEALAFLPDCADDTIQLLASLQGTRDDRWREEEPGKIMHELRVGEMARLNEIPQTPYYGSVDATPLFLILLARHAAWTGRLDLFTSVRPHVDRALEWIDQVMARGGGYLTYSATSRRGLKNQGWKDSSDSIVNDDGRPAEPPIALVEVQAYVYAARLGVADLYQRSNESDIAARLLASAEELRQRFERDFWIDDLESYALALQKDHRPAAVVSSNPGHALWMGITVPGRAVRVAQRFMQADMFTGWGLRTLSSLERRYNPTGYHTGTVWPHDNAIAVAGLRRYGCLDEARRIMSAMIEAAACFDHDRLPEVFSGFDRTDFPKPVHYPVACHPQAWAAGAVPFMLESVLGLEPNAFAQHLHIGARTLPAGVDILSLEGLRVGVATVDLMFARGPCGRVAVEDVKVHGALDVSVESE